MWASFCIAEPIIFLFTIKSVKNNNTKRRLIWLEFRSCLYIMQNTNEYECIWISHINYQSGYVNALRHGKGLLSTTIKNSQLSQYFLPEDTRVIVSETFKFPNFPSTTAFSISCKGSAGGALNCNVASTTILPLLK